MDKETELKIISLYNEGVSLKNIQSIVCVQGTKKIYYILDKYGIEKNRKRTLSVDDNLEKYICEQYNNGRSIASIVKETKLHTKLVSDLLKRNNIKIRDNTIVSRKYKLNENYFDEINTGNKAYVLGILYADGNIGSKKNTVCLSLSKDDVDVLEKIKNDMESERPLYFRNFKKYNRNQNDQYALIVNSKHMHTIIQKYNLIPCKTHYLQYPDFLKDNQHSHFLRGVLDGDGCIHKPYGKNGKVKLVDICGTKSFCDGAKKIIEKFLDIHCSVIRVRNGDSTYKITISGGLQVKKFLKWIYSDADIFMERKFKTYKTYYCDKVS